MSAIPKDIQADGSNGVLRIVWSDDSRKEINLRRLRQSCACARCVHEITGEPLLDPDSVPEDIRIEKMSLVGNYAVKIFWSDGHDTGLFTWDVLRGM